MTKPLRIGLIMLIGKGWMGGSEYIKNIALALSSLPDKDKEAFETSLIYSESSTDVDTLKQLETCFDNVYDLDKELKVTSALKKVEWKLREKIFHETNPRISDLLNRGDLNLNFIYPYFIDNRNKTLKVRACHWIPDFQHKYLPHLFTPAEIKIRDKVFERIAKSIPRIALSSHIAASDFQKFYPDSNTKVEVLQFRTSIQESWYRKDTITIQTKYNLPNRFFLVSNQFWQHKNHEIILEALKILKRKSIYPVIAFTGSTKDYRNPKYINSILQTIHTYGLESQTYLLGLIPKQDQMQLMRRSIAVIQPSLFEGWSTVVEDARCLGKKILLSDFPVHLEQNPPNSKFFDRYSAQQLADLMDESWHDSSVTPDLEQEALARARNIQEVQEFAYRFLEIAKDDH